MELSRALNEIASRNGYRQADICKATGISDAHISQIFSGKIKDPKASIVYKIAHAMNSTVDEIVELAQSYEGKEAK